MNSTLFEILAALRPGPTDASTLLARLRTLGGEAAAPSLPALYRYLKRALDRGWIEVEGVAADGPGRPAQSYALTPVGAGAVEEEAHRLARFTRLATGDEGSARSRRGS